MILSTMWEQLFVEITGKRGFPPHKRNNCRICLVDKFGNYHGRSGIIGFKQKTKSKPSVAGLIWKGGAAA